MNRELTTRKTRSESKTKYEIINVQVISKVNIKIAKSSVAINRIFIVIFTLFLGSD